jgi:hypothetical protein
MYLRRHSTLAGLAFAILLGMTSMAQGLSVHPSNTLPSADVALDPALNTASLPNLATGSIFDSGDSLNGSLILNGFSTAGTLSFQTPSSNFSGGETLSYSIDQSIVLAPGNYQLFSYANGTFGGNSGTLVFYEVKTSLIDTSSNPTTQLGSAVALYAPFSGQSLTSSTTTDIFSGLSSIITIPSNLSTDSLELQQTVTVSFTGLTTNEDVYVNFPNGSGIVPEPSSLTLLGIGVCGLVGYSWRRRKDRRGNASLLALA